MSHSAGRRRAVAVIIRDDRVLLVRRRRTGVEEYFVIPGGGVEAGEIPTEAVIRELREETGLGAVQVEALWEVSHESGPAHYFRVFDDGGEPTLGGPEADRNSADNNYHLEWVASEDVRGLNLQPADIKERLLSLLAGQ